MNKNKPIMASCCMLAALATVFAASGQVNVTEHHNHASRDGLYIDPQFTPAGAAALTRDLAFSGSITGNVFAQPLYIEGNPNGKAMVIAVTEANNVYALDATNGTIIWSVNVGPSVPLSFLNCGSINPSGITGTPIVDLPSRSLLFDAVVLNTQSDTPEHLIYSLDVDTGSVNEGWPVHVDGNAQSGSTVFVSQNQGQRGALAIVGSNVYVPYGGLNGDCDTYYGWVVGVPLSNPSTVMAWATSALKGGIWSVNGVSSDGTSPFFATGNTYNANGWGGGEAIIHPQPNLVLPSGTGNYWAPVNWASLDSSDLDIGSSGALLVDVPGATPSALVAAFGKDGNAYLLNRANLGGISAPVAQLHVASGVIITAAATYQTSKGTYVVYANGGYLYALRIGASNPPTITSVWSASEGGGSGSPFVTSTDGTNNVIVWGIGSENDQRLHAFDGDTGASIFTGGGANELMAGTRRWNTAIVARGRIYVANDNMVYAFSVPTTGPSPVANNDSYTFTENTVLTVGAPGVLANDTDNAGYTLTAVLASGPAHGTLNLNANGGFTYTPATNFSGSDSFTYYATDGTSNSSVATVTLTGLAAGVLFSDNFARATNPGPLTPWVAQSGDWTVTGGMMQGDGATSGYGAVHVTNSWSNYTVQGSVRFSTTSAYGAGLSGRLNPANGARYAAWVYPENSANGGPMLKLIKFQSWTGWSYQGNSYTPMQEATLSGVGTNWHTLQLSFQGNQIAVLYDGNEVISVADAEASPYANGAIGFDMYADSTSYTFSGENVTVTGSGAAPPSPKPAPVANNDSYNFTENTTLAVGAPGVLANDTDTAGFTLTAVLASNPAHGTLTLNANGSFTYTPTANFSGSDSFTYYATDGTSNSSAATVTLTGLATGVLFSDNFARATNPGPLTPWVAQSSTWTVTGGMMQEDDAGQGYGAAYVTNSWSNYTVQGSVRFSTTGAYGGGISGRLNPATGARYAAWIYPEASPADGPLLKLIKFQSWTGWSYQGSSYMPMQQATLSSVGTNWHTLQLSFQGNQIAVFCDGNEALNVADAEASPYANGAIGIDTYTGSTPYTLSVENVTVTGSAAAAPEPNPVASNDSFGFTENTPLTIAAPGVLANDTDNSGYTLTAVLASGPANGTLTLNANGGFTYTPATNFSGTDSFAYYATDGVSNSSVATVTLTGTATTVLFSDNFAGPLAPWVAESGIWTVTGGMMEGVGAASSYGAVYVTNSWSNYTAQGSIRFTSTSAYGGGLTARLNPATGARYAAWVYPENSPSGGPTLKLIKFQTWIGWSYQGAAYTPIQQVNLSGVGTNWHTLQLSVQGNQIAVSFDGNQVVNATDAEASPYSKGGIGFDIYTGSTGYTFGVENVTVNH